MDHGGADTRADQDKDGDERGVREAGHADDQSGDAPCYRKAPPEHEQADQASDPQRAGGEVQPVGKERCATRRRLGRVACQARDEQGGAGREERTPEGEQLGDRPPLPLGPVDPERDCPGDDEECEGQLEIEIASTEGRVAHER